MLPRGLILLLLDRTDAKCEPRDAVGLVGLDDLLCELDGFLDFAACQQREESAVKKLLVIRVRPQGSAVIGGCRRGIAIGASVTCRQIGAKRREAQNLSLRRCLRRGRFWQQQATGDERGTDEATEQRGGGHGAMVSIGEWRIRRKNRYAAPAAALKNGPFASWLQEDAATGRMNQHESAGMAASWPGGTFYPHIFG
jgi:hypothetical protein